MTPAQIIFAFAVGIYLGGFVATFPHIAFMVAQPSESGEWPAWRCLWQSLCVSFSWPIAWILLAVYFVLTIRDRKQQSGKRQVNITINK